MRTSAVAAPTYCGYITQYTGDWRWVEWIHMIANGILFIAEVRYMTQSPREDLTANLRPSTRSSSSRRLAEPRFSVTVRSNFARSRTTPTFVLLPSSNPSRSRISSSSVAPVLSSSSSRNLQFSPSVSGSPWLGESPSASSRLYVKVLWSSQALFSC